MSRRLSPPVALTACLAAGALTLSACGSDSLSEDENAAGGGGDDGGGESVEVEADESLAEMVPDEIAEEGTLAIGTDATYAPNEFLDEDGETIVGFNMDLFDAVAAKLGLETSYENAGFDTIITGVQGGRYHVGVSSFTINEQRKEQVNMVSYFNAGTQWAVPEGNPADVDPEDACGLTVAVQANTIQHEEDLPPREEACESEGEPLEVQAFDGQDQVTATVANGGADAMLADSPIVAYAIQQSDGAIEAAGDVYDSAPYGYVVPLEQTEMAEALVGALEAIAEDGTYEEILSSWGQEDGMIDDFAVNP